MPRKSLAAELQAEASNATASPIRRSSRISSTSATPSAVTTRRSSAQSQEPAKVTKTRRLSQALDQTAPLTPSRKRIERSVSKSPSTSSKENVAASTPIKTRGRRSSISKLKDEEKTAPSSPSVTTRRQSLRAASASPSKQEPAKPRGRRASVTEKVIPLEAIEENQSEKSTKKPIRGRRSSVDQLEPNKTPSTRRRGVKNIALSPTKEEKAVEGPDETNLHSEKALNVILEGSLSKRPVKLENKAKIDEHSEIIVENKTNVNVTDVSSAEENSPKESSEPSEGVDLNTSAGSSSSNKENVKKDISFKRSMSPNAKIPYVYISPNDKIGKQHNSSFKECKVVLNDIDNAYDAKVPLSEKVNLQANKTLSVHNVVVNLDSSIEMVDDYFKSEKVLNKPKRKSISIKGQNERPDVLDPTKTYLIKNDALHNSVDMCDNDITGKTLNSSQKSFDELQISRSPLKIFENGKILSDIESNEDVNESQDINEENVLQQTSSPNLKHLPPSGKTSTTNEVIKANISENKINDSNILFNLKGLNESKTLSDQKMEFINDLAVPTSTPKEQHSEENKFDLNIKNIASEENSVDKAFSPTTENDNNTKICGEKEGQDIDNFELSVENAEYNKDKSLSNSYALDNDENNKEYCRDQHEHILSEEKIIPNMSNDTGVDSLLIEKDKMNYEEISTKNQSKDKKEKRKSRNSDIKLKSPSFDAGTAEKKENYIDINMCKIKEISKTTKKSDRNLKEDSLEEHSLSIVEAVKLENQENGTEQNKKLIGTEQILDDDAVNEKCKSPTQLGIVMDITEKNTEAVVGSCDIIEEDLSKKRSSSAKKSADDMVGNARNSFEDTILQNTDEQEENGSDSSSERNDTLNCFLADKSYNTDTEDDNYTPGDSNINSSSSSQHSNVSYEDISEEVSDVQCLDDVKSPLKNRKKSNKDNTFDGAKEEVKELFLNQIVKSEMSFGIEITDNTKNGKSLRKSNPKTADLSNDVAAVKSKEIRRSLRKSDIKPEENSSNANVYSTDSNNKNKKRKSLDNVIVKDIVEPIKKPKISLDNLDGSISPELEVGNNDQNSSSSSDPSVEENDTLNKFLGDKSYKTDTEDENYCPENSKCNSLSSSSNSDESIEDLMDELIDENNLENSGDIKESRRKLNSIEKNGDEKPAEEKEKRTSLRKADPIIEDITTKKTLRRSSQKATSEDIVDPMEEPKNSNLKTNDTEEEGERYETDKFFLDENFKTDTEDEDYQPNISKISSSSSSVNSNVSDEHLTDELIGEKDHEHNSAEKKIEKESKQSKLNRSKNKTTDSERNSSQNKELDENNRETRKSARKSNIETEKEKTSQALNNATKIEEIISTTNTEKGMRTRKSGVLKHKHISSPREDSPTSERPIILDIQNKSPRKPNTTKYPVETLNTKDNLNSSNSTTSSDETKTPKILVANKSCKMDSDDDCCSDTSRNSSSLASLNGNSPKSVEENMSAQDFLDNSAEDSDKWEDDASVGSNDIIDEGESIHTETSSHDSDHSDLDDSFINDDDEGSLLSGTDSIIEAVKLDPYYENLQPLRRKRRVIQTNDDSSDSSEVFKTPNKLELDAEPIPENKASGSKETEKKPIINSYDNLKSLEELNKSTKERKSVSGVESLNIKKQKSSRLSNSILFDKNTSIRCDTPHNSGNELESSAKKNRKRASSLNIQENLPIKDIQKGVLSNKISKVVDIFSSGLNDKKGRSGNVSVNISIEYSDGSDDCTTTVQPKTMKETANKNVISEDEMFVKKSAFEIYNKQIQINKHIKTKSVSEDDVSHLPKPKKCKTSKSMETLKANVEKPNIGSKNTETKRSVEYLPPELIEKLCDNTEINRKHRKVCPSTMGSEEWTVEPTGTVVKPSKTNTSKVKSIKELTDLKSRMLKDNSNPKRISSKQLLLKKQKSKW